MASYTQCKRCSKFKFNTRTKACEAPECSGDSSALAGSGDQDSDTFSCDRCEKSARHAATIDQYAGRLWVCSVCGYKTARQEKTSIAFRVCPNCKRTEDTYGFSLNVFVCQCGKQFCDHCSGGGFVGLPCCPVSAYHENRDKIGVVRPKT